MNLGVLGTVFFPAVDTTVEGADNIAVSICVKDDTK